MSNDKICEVLEVLRQRRITQGETYKARAYEKAIATLKVSPPITSGRQAMQLPGIGTSIGTKIDEILQTGTVVELGTDITTPSTPNPNQEILQLFMSVERVGEKTAQRWLEKGYRKLSDIPREECNEGQWLCLQLYPELSQRIPRAEIQLVEEELKKTGVQFQICGSYRRGKETSGDVDILLVGGEKELNQILTSPIFKHTLARGSKKWMGIIKVDQLHRRCDIEIVSPDEYPYAVVYFTGPAKFNVGMRDKANKMGMRLNEKGLFRVDGTNAVANTEEEVFKLLEMEYLTPEQREQFA